MARVARMLLADQALAVLGSALRDPSVVLRYQAKIDAVPGSECLWWSGAVSGRVTDASGSAGKMCSASQLRSSDGPCFAGA